MALNKRFLGLGFTFTAQDKGLEKKLVRIAALFDRINKASTGGGKSSGGSSGRATSSSGGGSTRRTAGTYLGAESKSAKTSQKNLAKDNVGIIHSVMSDYEKALGPLADSFSLEMKRVLKDSYKSGSSLESVMSRMSNIAERYVESTDLLDKKLQPLLRTFKYLKEYSSSVGKSIEGFFETLGLSFRDMIPKEVSAAFRVFKSIITPLGHGLQAVGKNIYGRINASMKSKMGKDVAGVKLPGAAGEGSSEKIVTAVMDSQKAVTAEIRETSNPVLAAIGNSKSIPTLQKLLNLILGKNSGDKKDDSWMSGLIGPILAGLAAFVAGPLVVGSEIFKGLRAFAKDNMIVKGIGFLGEKLSALAKWISESRLGEWIASVGKSIAESRLGQWIKGIGEAIAESKVGSYFIKIGEVLGEAFEIFKVIGGKIWTAGAKIVEVFGKVFEGLLKFAESSKIFSIFKIFGEGLGKFIPLLGEILILIDVVRGLYTAFQDATGIIDFFRKALLNIVNNLFVGLPEKFMGGLWNKIYGEKKAPSVGAIPQQLSQQTPVGSIQDNVAALKNQQNIADNSEYHVTVAEKTNELLQRLIDVTTGGKGGVIDINLKSNSREVSASAERRNMDASLRMSTGGV